MLALIALLLAAAPTLKAYQQSVFTDQAITETVPSVSWAAGDVVVILGVSADFNDQIITPTVTGLTFAAVAGSPTTSDGSCRVYGWSATAYGSGSGAIASAISSGHGGGIAVWVYGDSEGVGNVSISGTLGSTMVQSLVRGSADSAVVQAWGDWNAVNDTTVTWTPSSGVTQRIASWVSGIATYFAADWPGQGSAGTTSYGFTAGSATKMSAITVEVKGTASIPPPPQRVMVGVGK